MCLGCLVSETVCNHKFGHIILVRSPGHSRSRIWIHKWGLQQSKASAGECRFPLKIVSAAKSGSVALNEKLSHCLSQRRMDRKCMRSGLLKEHVWLDLRNRAMYDLDKRLKALVGTVTGTTRNAHGQKL